MIIPPADMVGRTFLTNPLDDGKRCGARILRAVDTKGNKTNRIFLQVAIHGDILDNGCLDRKLLIAAIYEHIHLTNINTRKIKISMLLQQ